LVSLLLGSKSFDLGTHCLFRLSDGDLVHAVSLLRDASATWRLAIALDRRWLARPWHPGGIGRLGRVCGGKGRRWCI
jgi:hypothetical protein